MSKPHISVIIPVYNAATTILRCVNSVVSTNANIEIICVDDGSKDNSYQILQELAEQDNRVVVLHQTNAGAGEARNTGLRNAHGDYIMFCDADDAYLYNTVDLIYDDIKCYEPDYIVFHRKTVLLDGQTQIWGSEEDTLRKLDCVGSQYMNTFFMSRSHGSGVVTKVFKKSIIDANEIKFQKFKFGEDLCFILEYIIHAKTIIEDYRAFYQQWQSSGSLCLSSNPDYYDLNLACINFFESKYPEESLNLSVFFNRYKCGLLFRSIERILEGVDTHSNYEKYRFVRTLVCRPDIKSMLNVIASSNAFDEDLRKKCKKLSDGHITTYMLETYYIPYIKRLLKRIIGYNKK